MNEINNQLQKIAKYKNNPKYAEAYKIALAALNRRKFKVVQGGKDKQSGEIL